VHFLFAEYVVEEDAKVELRLGVATDKESSWEDTMARSRKKCSLRFLHSLEFVGLVR